jgi:hypothetical protein
MTITECNVYFTECLTEARISSLDAGLIAGGVTTMLLYQWSLVDISHQNRK